MMLRKTITIFCLLLLLPASLQAQQQSQPRRLTLQKTPAGLVYVSQRIDLVEEAGSEANVFTLDGEPLPTMQTRNVTLGLAVDDRGYVVARLAGVTPRKPPQDVQITLPQGLMIPAEFIGMDTVTGLSLLKTEKPLSVSPVFADSAVLPAPGQSTLFGLNPQNLPKTIRNFTAVRPRIKEFACTLAKATDDFRYSQKTPLYRLVSPGLSPVQDGSLVASGDGKVFGIALYDLNGSGTSLVYPATRVLNLARIIIQANNSIASGWLGASGRDFGKDSLAPMQTPQVKADAMTSRSTGKFEAGVQVTGVFPDSPAEVAGIQPNDLLLNISGRRITNLVLLGDTLRQLPADSEVSLTIRRGGEYKVLQARLSLSPGLDQESQLNHWIRRLADYKNELQLLPNEDPKRPKLESKIRVVEPIISSLFGAAPPEVRLRSYYGVEVAAMTNSLREFFATSGQLLVVNVPENSRLAKAGLQAGDVLVKVGDEDIADVPSLVKALDENSTSQEVIRLTVTRQRAQAVVNLMR